LAEIFISHSTKIAQPGEGADRILARDIRDRLFIELGLAGHKAMLDERSLLPGDAWYAKLQRWLGECHGAVLIVDAEGLGLTETRRGLGSSWLRKEAAILSWRRSQIEDFRLVTVLVGVSLAQVQAAGFDDLVRYQIIDARGGADGTVPKVVDAFKSFETFTDRSPMARWIRDAADLLARADGAFDAAAACLAIEPGHLAAYGDKEITIAHALLHAKPKTAARALRELLRSMPGDAFRSLVRHVTPVCVDVAAGAALHRLIGEPPREAVINAANPGVGRVYLDRARLRHQLMTDGIVLDGIAGEGGERELEHALVQALLDGAAQNEAMPDHFRTLKPDEQELALNLYYDDQEKFFLLIGSSVRSAILQPLRARMPDATFILLPEFDEAAACAASLRVPMVEPKLERLAHIVLLNHLTSFGNLEKEAG